MVGKEKYQNLFESLIEGFFNFELVLTQIKEVDESEKLVYLNFVLNKFREKTVAEWMGFYSVENLQKYLERNPFKKDIIEHYDYDFRVSNVVFTETALGGYVKQNLEGFEQKCKNEIDKI
jgi:hypothetical protein